MTDALFGELSAEDEQRLEQHLSTCADCAEEFRTLQATLEVTAQRERPEPPPSFWHGYWPRLARRMEREASPTPSLTEQLAAWWRNLPTLVPVPRWAVQGALALVLVIGGYWFGRQQAAPAASETPLIMTDEEQAPLSDLLVADQPIRASSETIQPHLANVQDITFNVSDGTIEIRYNTVNDIVVRGRPDDPAIRRLLQTAMLNEENPSARLNALQAVEKAKPSANDELVQALTYLAKEESNENMRFRAVRALRSLHQDRSMQTETRNVLINILLNSTDSALRIEALRALMENQATSPDEVPDYLYEAQNDSNSYVRYQATQALQEINATPTPSNVN